MIPPPPALIWINHIDFFQNPARVRWRERRDGQPAHPDDQRDDASIYGSFVPMPRTAIDILKRSGLFQQIGQTTWPMLECIAQVRRFKPGALIFHQGRQPPGLYVVDQGAVRVFKTAPTGKQHVLNLAGPGQTFAEVAVLGDFATPAAAEAIETTVCALLPADALRLALEQDHDLCLQLLTGLSRHVRRMVGLLGDVVLHDAIGRVARYLLDQRKVQGDIITLPGPKKHLASHLNLTSETLSRTLRRLLDAGVITHHDDRRIHIHQPNVLAAAVQGLFPR